MKQWYLRFKAGNFENGYYEIGEKYIRSKDGRIKYTFAGLRHNLDSLKSKAKLLLCWVDEAESVSDTAWRKLIPTVREEGSEIWVTWNPEEDGSDTDNRFKKDPPRNSKIVELNWRDNPWFPTVLNIERLEDKRKRPKMYDHVWEGDYLEVIEGAYFEEQYRACKDEGRITKLPRLDSQPCWTFWDIGNSDGTAVWVVQKVGQEYRVIDFYEEWGKPYSHAVKWIKSLDLIWDTMYLPHDASHERQGKDDNKSPQDMLHDLMPSVEWEIVPRIAEINWGIQQTRDMFPLMWFDEVKCAKGLEHIKKYKKKWSEHEKRWLDKPDKSKGHSEAADALRQMAQAYAGGQLNISGGWSGGSIKRNLKGYA